MYRINEEICTGCGACLNVCSAGAIYMIDNKAHIDDNRCTDCRACGQICPTNAIQEKEVAWTGQERVSQNAQTVAPDNRSSPDHGPFLSRIGSMVRHIVSRPPEVFETGRNRIGFPGHGKGYRKRCGRRIRRIW